MPNGCEAEGHPANQKPPNLDLDLDIDTDIELDTENDIENENDIETENDTDIENEPGLSPGLSPGMSRRAGPLFARNQSPVCQAKSISPNPPYLPISCWLHPFASQRPG